MALSERGDDDDALERPAFEQQAVALAAQLPQGGGGDGSRQPQAAAVAPTAAESGGDGSPKADVDSSNGLHRNISTKESLEPKLSTASSEHGSEASSGMSPPHYNAGDDIILRLEFLRTNEMKVGLASGGRCIARFFSVLLTDSMGSGCLPYAAPNSCFCDLCRRRSFARCGRRWWWEPSFSSLRCTSKSTR